MSCVRYAWCVDVVIWLYGYVWFVDMYSVYWLYWVCVVAGVVTSCCSGIPTWLWLCLMYSYLHLVYFIYLLLICTAIYHSTLCNCSVFSVSVLFQRYLCFCWYLYISVHWFGFWFPAVNIGCVVVEFTISELRVSWTWVTGLTVAQAKIWVWGVVSVHWASMWIPIYIFSWYIGGI